MSNIGVITTVYAGTERGLLAGFDDWSIVIADHGRESYYDYSKSEWYTRAKQTGKTCFTNVYMDVYNRGMTITCAAPFYDASGKFAGAVGMDILISDLYREIVELELGKDAYAFLVDGNGNIISPTDLNKGEARSIYQDRGISSLVAIVYVEVGKGEECCKRYQRVRKRSLSWKLRMLPRDLRIDSDSNA